MKKHWWNPLTWFKKCECGENCKCDKNTKEAECSSKSCPSKSTSEKK